MPIADIELICETAQSVPSAGLAQQLANELGRVFSSPPGGTWVRVRTLAPEQYAENDAEPGASEFPIFVTLLLGQLPVAAALEQQVIAVTAAVARVTGKDEQRIHVQYAPAASGRQAFGGHLVRGPTTT